MINKWAEQNVASNAIGLEKLLEAEADLETETFWKFYAFVCNCDLCNYFPENIRMRVIIRKAKNVEPEIATNAAGYICQGINQSIPFSYQILQKFCDVFKWIFVGNRKLTVRTMLEM